MIESINNFAGFNLSAILGGTFAGIFFLLVFHYLRFSSTHILIVCKNY